jgi:hypothetical protein
MMAPNSHHLIQISIVEEYRIFRMINLDKNDDFVYSTKNVYLYFAVSLFLNKKTHIINVLAIAIFRYFVIIILYCKSIHPVIFFNKIHFFIVYILL